MCHTLVIEAFFASSSSSCFWNKTTKLLWFVASGMKAKPLCVCVYPRVMCLLWPFFLFWTFPLFQTKLLLLIRLLNRKTGPTFGNSTSTVLWAISGSWDFFFSSSFSIYIVTWFNQLTQLSQLVILLCSLLKIGLEISACQWNRYAQMTCIRMNVDEWFIDLLLFLSFVCSPSDGQ